MELELLRAVKAKQFLRGGSPKSRQAQMSELKLRPPKAATPSPCKRVGSKLHAKIRVDAQGPEAIIHQLSIKKGRSVSFGVERNHVVDLLASTYEADGQAEFARDGDDDAAFGCAV